MRRPGLLLVAGVLALALAVPVVAGPAAPAAAAVPSPRPDLAVSTAASGLSHPWDAGFLPNGRMLVTERSGRLVRIAGGTPVPMAIPGDVVASGEGGMLGLAVDPNWSANGYVYVCMASSRSGPTDVRVVRFRLDAPGTHVVGRTDIVTGLPYSTGRHSGCRPRFGPDGYLWVGTGDAAQGTNPQDAASLGGKVLRVDRNGNAAPGNPGGRRWYTKGHRNVQGLAFLGSTPYSVEHGPDRDDEINRLVAGGNHGWDPVPGYNESVPMTDLAKFPGARRAVWSSGSPTLAPSGATFLTSGRWGAWEGGLAVATLKGRHLRVFFLAGSGDAVRGSVRLLDGHGRLRSPVMGPDGDLYVTTDAGSGAGRVLRVTPTRTGAGGFPDVSCDAFYTVPVQWMVDERITTGVGSTGRFQPDRTVDRGQQATFLWRYAGRPARSRPPGFFGDVPSSAYYHRAVVWMAREGLTTGVGSTGRYQPGKPLTRAEMVTFLWRYSGAPRGNPFAGFVDLQPGAYYVEAVRWAKARGITTGVGGSSRFAPNAPVTRGQTATFLHRLAGAPPVTVRGC